MCGMQVVEVFGLNQFTMWEKIKVKILKKTKNK